MLAFFGTRSKATPFSCILGSMNKSIQQRTDDKSPFPIIISLGIWFSTLCWGSAYVAARFLLQPETAGHASLSPALLAALRFGIAALFFVFPLGQAILHHRVSRRELLLMSLLGLYTYSLYFWLQYIGIQETNASIASILGVGLIPIFTTLLAQVTGTERLNISLWAVLLLGFVGVMLIVFQQPFSVSLRSGFLLGSLCLIFNTFSFALYSYLSKQWMRTISPIVLTAGTMISGAIGLIILSFLDPEGNHWSEVVRLDGVQWLALLFLAVACSVLAYFAYNRALNCLDASRVNVYFYFEPLVAIALGVTLLGERLTWQIVVGSMMITLSVVLVNSLKKLKKET